MPAGLTGSETRDRGSSARSSPVSESGFSGTPSAEARAFLYCWLLPGLAVLSAASAKRSIYLIPLVPAAALLVAAWWRSRPARRRLGRAAGIAGWILFAIGVVCAAALPVFIGAALTGAEPRDPGGALAAVAAEPSGVPAAAALLAALAAVALLVRRDPGRGARGALVLAYVLFFVAGAILLPLAAPRLSARSMGEEIRRQRDNGATVAAYRLTEGAMGQFLFYSGGTVDWIGRSARETQSECTECRSTLRAGEYLRLGGRRAVLLTADDYEKVKPGLPPSRIAARRRVGGSVYVLVASAGG